MLKELIEQIQAAVKGESVKIRDKEYSTRPVFLPPNEELISEITVYSLTGLIDYLNEKLDGLKAENLFIHVETARKVRVYEQVSGKEGVRHSWIEATANLQNFRFGDYLPTDNFIASFQSLFEREKDFESVLKYVSNIVKEEAIETSDDSVSQKITTQSGVKRQTETVKNPVTLAPIRTFTEIKQPASPFVLRLKNDSDVRAALYEADNGKWENEARQAIKEYLAKNLKVKISILA